MILYLDTTEKIAEIKLYNDKLGLIDEAFFDCSFILSEELTQRIESLINKNDFSKKDLTAIAINCGPGSYTGVRIGVTTANAIAFALNIPIIKISTEEGVEKVLKKTELSTTFSSPVLPIYSNPPHITKKKVD